MTELQKRLVGVVAGAAVLINSAMPVFATEVVISGNGAGSNNYATVTQTTTTAVSQTNNANISNDVHASASTGDNKSSFNTGGDSVISTGDASSKVDVSTDMNTNAAQVNCCATGDTTVKIDGNSAFTDNQVKLDQTSTTAVTQANEANVENKVYADANSGDNKAESNTGGSTAILTGKASTDVSISNSGNTNAAMVGGDSAPASSASFVISGNGAGSNNWITAELEKTTAISQQNEANIDNYVHAKAESGDNKASFNTGGDNLIHTGKADSTVAVDNAVNFNFAEVDCGCTWDVLAKITGNSANPCLDHLWCDGKDPNGIELDLTSTQAYLQGNDANLDNAVASGAKADTGDNQLFANTGLPSGDPAVLTGNASTDVTVANSGNVNQIGGGFEMPSWPTNLGDLNVSFNLGAFLAFFGISL